MGRLLNAGIGALILLSCSCYAVKMNPPSKSLVPSNNYTVCIKYRERTFLGQRYTLKIFDHDCNDIGESGYAVKIGETEPCRYWVDRNGNEKLDFSTEVTSEKPDDFPDYRGYKEIIED
jgi:hypothetical protein